MATVNIVILICTILLLTSFLAFKKAFSRLSIFLYIILFIWIGGTAYNDYEEAVNLYIGSEAGTLQAVPYILKSIYFTLFLVIIYSFLNIVLLTLFYKKQIRTK